MTTTADANTASPLVRLGLAPEPFSYAEELNARLRGAVEERRGGPCTVVGLWACPSGYTNIGAYVAEICVSPEQTERDIVVKWGFGCVCWEVAIGPEEDVSTALQDYAEAMHGIPIGPTDELMAAFTPWYLEQHECWAQAAMRASRGYASPELSPRSRQFDAELIRLEQAHEAASFVLAAWWKTSASVDYALPPPPSGIQHDAVHLLAAFSCGESTYRQVEGWGQVVCCPTCFRSGRTASPMRSSPACASFTGRAAGRCASSSCPRRLRPGGRPASV